MASIDMDSMNVDQQEVPQAGSSRGPGDSSRQPDDTNPQEPPSKKPKRKPRQSEPSDVRQPGTSVFPTARVQRILKVDEDMTRMSREAVFLTSIAAEHFVKRLASQGWLRARLAQKKLLTLDHLASVVKQEEEFHFLEDERTLRIVQSVSAALTTQVSEAGDIIPQTVPLSVALAGRQAKETSNPNLPSYTPQTIQEVIPPSTLHASTHPDHLGALAKNERGAHHRRVGIAGGAGEGAKGGAGPAAAQGKRKSTGGKAASPEQVKSAPKARSSSRRRSVAKDAEGGALAEEPAAVGESREADIDDEDVEMRE